ncbi:MAG: glycosyltransferase family 2 protein [bacterium]
MNEEIELTVVVPCYNEENNIVPLVEELTGVLEGLGRRYEILYVDDCSTDSSVARIENLQARRPKVRFVRHRINSGESAAEATGFRNARGSVIITIDADLQNDPADIPHLLESLSEADVVCGIRRRREDDWVKRISSKIANAFRNTITGDQVADAGCTFRALKKEAVMELPIFNGLHRFLPTLARYQGFVVTEILVNHRPRQSGESKYGVGNRLWRGILDCLVMRWFKRRCVSARRIAEKRNDG